MQVTDKGQVMIFRSGNIVVVGDVVSTFRGELVTVTGGRAPDRPGSAGRVYVRSEKGHEMEYYPSVINAEWREAK